MITSMYDEFGYPAWTPRGLLRRWHRWQQRRRGAIWCTPDPEHTDRYGGGYRYVTKEERRRWELE